MKRQPIVIHPFNAYLSENAVNTFWFNIRMTDFSPENVMTIKDVIDGYYTSDWQYSFFTYNERMKDNYYQFRHLRNTVLIAALVTLIISLIGLIGYVAKFPSLKDDYDVGLWEHLCHLLAKTAGINVAETKTLAKMTSVILSFLADSIEQMMVGGFILHRQ